RYQWKDGRLAAEPWRNPPMQGAYRPARIIPAGNRTRLDSRPDAVHTEWRVMPSDVRTGTLLAGFRIDSPLGEGAMGAVFLAKDTRRGGDVALKVLARDLAQDEPFRRRFLRQSRLAASLGH